MNRTWKHGIRKVVILHLVSSCVGAWAAGRPRCARDRAMVTKMMGQKNTVCVAIDIVEGSETAFAGRVAAREAERVREPDFTTGYSLMWESQGAANELSQPYLSMNKSTSAALSSQPCLQLDKTLCRAGEVMFDISRFDARTPSKRKPTRSSAHDPIVKLVSMLP